MRIAQLATNEECVPPIGYGGTELVVSLLTEDLVERGHSVSLFSPSNSKTAARLISVRENGLRAANVSCRRWQAFDIRTLMKLTEMRDEFDIVHNHMGWQALPWLARLGLPVVTTNHNPIKPYCADIYFEYGHLPFVAISDAYKRLNYPDKLNYVDVVYNGIDVDSFIFNGAGERSYLLFIGRLCEDKGTETAIQIAEKLKVPIVLAGKVDAADQSYFESRIRPHLATSRVEFIGEVDHARKSELYRGAIATVYPINFEEPFGLVMVESLAAGTPVMAFDRGSVRELLTDGETAVIGSSVEDLVSRFSQVKSLDPGNCRRRVQDLFSKRRMVDSYERIYERLCGASG